MLKLVNITKDYTIGDQKVHALRGVSIDFRRSEFVAILGQSGCGKTTLMNIIGGLDRMTSGDIIIDGISTAKYDEKDWDDYRNRRIGFVFQNYNLIQHLSVLNNVELALTISGVGSEERIERAKKALISVGLENEMNKRPNQLAGGQMQRVAIARAIVNEPEILLADEPTGAVDSETSIQIMDILNEISKTRLVIMVTHNAELADKYSTRIIKALDGQIIDDSNPYVEGEEETVEDETPQQEITEKEKRKRRKSSTMSFFTSIKLAWKNIINKRGRSILTAIAGSIGIIAIALILALNNGFNIYIKDFEEQSMARYPISVTSGTTSVINTFKEFLGGDFFDGDSLNYGAILDLFTDQDTNREKYTKEELVYIYGEFAEVFHDMMNRVNRTNDITKFKKYTDDNFNDSWGTVKYDYSIGLNIYRTKNDVYTQINPLSENEVLLGLVTSFFDEGAVDTVNEVASLLNEFPFWDEIIGDMNVIANQYDVLAGHLPTSKEEVVLVLDDYNQITDFDLVLMEELEIIDFIASITDTTFLEDYTMTFDQVFNQEYYILPTSKAFVYDEGTSCYKNLKTEGGDALVQAIENDSIKVKISGIIRPKPGTAGCIDGMIGYTSELSQYIINDAINSDYVRAQVNEYNRYINQANEIARIQKKMVDENLLLEELDEDEKIIMNNAPAKLKNVLNQQVIEESTYNNLLQKVNYRDLDKPAYIYFYTTSVENKEHVSEFVAKFNAAQKAEEDAITEETGFEPTTTYVVEYKDELDSAVTELTSMTNTITYILIAVAMVSVLVTMILIAIVMYISVQDRTREIGIMRSLGARKLDISNVFNVETLILGFVSGLLGVIVGLIFIFPANAILHSTMGVSGMMKMAVWHPFVLIAGAIFITVLSGLIPSILAAKKDPVIALRTE